MPFNGTVYIPQVSPNSSFYLFGTCLKSNTSDFQMNHTLNFTLIGTVNSTSAHKDKIKIGRLIFNMENQTIPIEKGGILIKTTRGGWNMHGQIDFKDFKVEFKNVYFNSPSMQIQNVVQAPQRGFLRRIRKIVQSE